MKTHIDAEINKPRGRALRYIGIDLKETTNYNNIREILNGFLVENQEITANKIINLQNRSDKMLNFMFLLAINNDIEMLLSEIPGQNNLQHRRQAIDHIYYRKSCRFLPKPECLRG